MYESKHQTPLSRFKFAGRLLAHLLAAIALLGASLGIGIVGYLVFEHLSLIDGLLNSAMLLGGMGPVDPPVTPGGKVFASLYALYAGLVFVVTAALLVTPLLHRLLHRFHWDGGR